MSAFAPHSKSIVYIGKAIRETIYSRCRKHRAALREERLPSGQRSMRPGKNFKAYRAAAGGSLEGLYVIPGFMSLSEPYLISCAEEYCCTGTLSAMAGPDPVQTQSNVGPHRAVKNGASRASFARASHCGR